MSSSGVSGVYEYDGLRITVEEIDGKVIATLPSGKLVPPAPVVFKGRRVSASKPKDKSNPSS